MTCKYQYLQIVYQDVNYTNEYMKQMQLSLQKKGSLTYLDSIVMRIWSVIQWRNLKLHNQQARDWKKKNKKTAYQIC